MRNVIFLFLFCTLIYSKTNAQWINLNLGNGFDILDFSFPDAQTGYISGYGGLLKKTTNGGTNWINYSFPTTQFNLNAIHFFNANTGLIASSNDTIYRTVNGTLNWADKIHIGFDVLDFQFFDSLNGYAAGYNKFAKTTNGGLNWNISNIQSSGQIFFINMNIGWTLYYIGSGISAILKTTDAGTTWQSQYTATDYKNLYDIFFLDENTGYASGYRHYIVKTTNGGVNWINQYEQSNAGGLYSIYFINTNTGWAVGDYYAATNTSTYYTTNGGTNWVNTNGITTGGRLNRVKINNSPVGYIGGQNQTMYRTTNAGGLTDLEVISERVPSEYLLKQNYPNPFNPSTTIRYELPKNSFVSLKIFNILGEEIISLVNENQSTGIYTVNWNAANFPGGIYFYTMRTENFSETKKMLMIK